MDSARLELSVVDNMSLGIRKRRYPHTQPTTIPELNLVIPFFL
jgi:hypothetical protein